MPFARFFRGEKRERNRYVCLLLLMVGLFLGLNTLLHVLLGWQHESSGIADTVTALRVFLGFVLAMYVPTAFWILIYWKKSSIPSPSFTQRNVAWTTLGAGLGLILFAQGPAFLVEGWLQDSLAPAFHAFYGMGFGFLMAGAFHHSTVRKVYKREILGATALVVGMGWWVFGGLRQGSFSYLWWSIGASVSSLIAFGGVFFLRGRLWILSFLGLVVMTAYGVGGPLTGKLGWFPFPDIADPRVMIPLKLFGILAWVTSIGWMFGVFRIFGEPFQDDPT